MHSSPTCSFCLSSPSLFCPSPSFLPAGRSLYQLPRPPTDPPPLYQRIRESYFLCSKVLRMMWRVFIVVSTFERSSAFFLFFSPKIKKKKNKKRCPSLCFKEESFKKEINGFNFLRYLGIWELCLGAPVLRVLMAPSGTAWRGFCVRAP